MLNREFIPFNRPEIGMDELNEVAEVLRSGWLTTGERTKRFEVELCGYTGARFGQAVNSCTAGLHLALAALNIGPGDEVITTPLTFCATVNVILHQGATPVLADIGDDFNISPAAIRERITPRTRAIIPVHFAGLPCRMTEIWEIARERGLAVVEDAAHAIGTHYRGHHIGDAAVSRSDAVAYSFYATKNLTTGEGGMVTTNREDLYERMRRMTLHGISRDAWNRYAENGSWYYEVVEPGFKYNLSDLQSAIGLVQLKKIEAMTARRAELAGLYDRLLGGRDDLMTPPDEEFGRHCWHLYVLRINPAALSISRDEFIKELHSRGIGTSVHFIPIPLHPFFKAWAGLEENQCPRAMSLYRQIISLPLYPGMSEEQVRRVAREVIDIADQSRCRESINVPELEEHRRAMASAT
ncbi:MAG: DegT/DnrJ/EryC1/StrS aminotransferase family protein [Bryobacterales bacterium]|nr:DegT/DnrJ/EryC1/StrS aminotransferase family protein [Bryobacterales bacterium]